MTGPFERWRNPGTNTYSAVKMFAELTGLPEAEVRKICDEAVAKAKARRVKSVSTDTLKGDKA